jgi:hypothetical protein
MHIVFNFPVGVVVGAVAAVVSKVVYTFVAKQVKSVVAWYEAKKTVVVADVKADASKVEADVAKKV